MLGTDPLLKAAKLITLQGAQGAGLFAALRESRWRRERLLILCYHGVSLVDEHLWNPELYVSRDFFERRLSTIREEGYNVLTLNDALGRLYTDRLPPRSVCITFDDGFHDFYAAAYPLLRQYQIPATVYLTSFYSKYQRPVFDLMCSYVLWLGRDRTLNTSHIPGYQGSISLSERSVREGLAADIRRLANRENYSAGQKDKLLQRLALQMGIDYDALVASGRLRLMSAAEIGMLDQGLVQVELHTHRHRIPLEEELFRGEIEKNREYINHITKRRANPKHFCYPSGVTSSAFLPRLRNLGIVSATTCRLGLASRADDPLLLPRFLDTSLVSPIEFESWLAGLSSKLPSRRLTFLEPTADGRLA